MTPCERSSELQAYHDGEASPEQSARLEQHVEQCSVCAEDLRQLRSLSHMFEKAREAETPAGMLERLQHNVCSGYTADAALVRNTGWLVTGFGLLWQYDSPRSDYAQAEFTLERLTRSQTFDELDETNPDPEVEIAFWIVDELSSNNGGY